MTLAVRGNSPPRQNDATSYISKSDNNFGIHSALDSDKDDEFVRGINTPIGSEMNGVNPFDKGMQTSFSHFTMFLSHNFVICLLACQNLKDLE